jgi:hypothetical protein
MSIDINFHNVTNVDFGSVNENNVNSQSRELVITHENGEQTTISLFAVYNSPEALKVTI